LDQTEACTVHGGCLNHIDCMEEDLRKARSTVNQPRVTRGTENSGGICML